MIRRALIAALVLGPTAPLAQSSTDPLSAIDWLSKSVTVTAPVSAPRDLDRSEPSVAKSATAPQVTVTPLGAAGFGAVGAVSSTTSGLPDDLWTASDPAEVVTLIRAQQSAALPALNDLLVNLLLTRAQAPAGGELEILLARIDKLLDMALLPQALALLEATDATSNPALFRRWFDVALLTGTEDDACTAMQSTPTLAPTGPARIFCLARAGNWPAAALMLNTSRALGDITAAEEALLARFLDPELFEGEPPLVRPDRISPLVFRMFEAIGEGLATTRLPLAFAYADLRDTAGLRTRLNAAERLAMHGALPAPQLAEIYLSRTPSASGGVWDRVDALQSFDTAARIDDTAAMERTLPAAWNAMSAIRAETLFANLYADGLTGLNGNIARTVRHLAGDPAPGGSDLVLALLQGDPATATTDTSLQDAVSAGFDGASPSPQLAALLDTNRTGEALLRAIAVFDAGVAGDGPAITDALRVLRAAGQDDVARRAAIQLLLLDRRI